MDQAFTCQPLTADIWVQSPDSPCGFFWESIAMGQFFPQVLLFFPVTIIPPMLYTYTSFLYH
jgi:hypothetical protein